MDFQHECNECFSQIPVFMGHRDQLKENTKHQYSILTHIYGIQEDGNDDPVCKTGKKDTDVYNGLLDSEGEGEGGMIWKNGNSNMYTVM